MNITKHSAKNEIEWLLKRGNHLSVKSADLLAHTTELRCVVSRLKKEGVPIDWYWEYSGTKKYKRYYYTGKIINVKA